MNAARPLPAVLLIAFAIGCDGSVDAGGSRGEPAATPEPPAPAVEPATDVVADEPRTAPAADPATEPPAAPPAIPSPPRFEREGDAVRISYDDLDLLKLGVEGAEEEGMVPPDAVERLPDWLAALDGERVRLRGFMYPPPTETVKGFMFARDNQLCCFGRDPKIYDLFPVRLKPGTEADYIQNRPFDVVGTFRISPERDGGEWYQIYSIDDARVIAD